MNTSRRGRRVASRARRRFIATAGLALALPGLAPARLQVDERDERQDLSLWYEKPAGPWVEALPVGNGRLGAMVFGCPAQERLQLNIDTLFDGGPCNPDNAAALEALPRVRALIDQGRFQEAQAPSAKALMAQPMTQMPYGPASDLFLGKKGLSGAARYRRWLDLDSVVAVAVTLFGDGAVRHRREAFCSEPDQVLVVRTDAQGASFDLDIAYRHSAKNVDFGANLRFALRIQAVGDGRAASVGDRIEVRGARSLTLLIAGATSFVSPTDVSGDPVAAVRSRTEGAARQSHAALRQRHLQMHRTLSRRMAIRLGPDTSGAAGPRPTNERIFAASTQLQPELAALYVQYARYLLLAPASLQGRRNEGDYPPWGGKYTININTEMNYRPAGPANLGESVEPLLRMVEQLSVTGARTARNTCGARGWVAPKGRGLVTSPSLSPENPHHPEAAVCAGPAMDRQILRDLFDHTPQAHAQLKEQDAAFAKALRAARDSPAARTAAGLGARVQCTACVRTAASSSTSHGPAGGRRGWPCAAGPARPSRCAAARAPCGWTARASRAWNGSVDVPKAFDDGWPLESFVPWRTVGGS